MTNDPPNKILIADDDSVNRDLIAALLSPQGYDLIMARDGQQALDKAIEDAPDLILLDVIMPKKSGFEVAEKLKGD
ncbi:MAG: response regulator, partial [Desulfobacteraceae bacterium]|nr:response regulator [Desulfobacteraceae bacterium]